MGPAESLTHVFWYGWGQEASSVMSGAGMCILTLLMFFVLMCMRRLSDFINLNVSMLAVLGRKVNNAAHPAPICTINVLGECKRCRSPAPVHTLNMLVKCK